MGKVTPPHAYLIHFQSLHEQIHIKEGRHSLPALSIKNAEKQLSQFVIETYLSCEMR